MKIIDSALHLPGQSYATADLRQVLAPQIADWASSPSGAQRTGRGLLGESFFTRLGVERRHLLIDPSDPGRWWQQHRGTRPIAHEGARSYKQLMQRHAPLGARDRLIVVANVFDTTAPGLAVGVLSALAAEDRGFVRPTLLGLAGEGCSGFVSALHEADVWLRAHPGTRVVIVSCEISSPYFWSPMVTASLGSDDSERTRSLLIQRFLFGDACVAAMCRDDSAGDPGIELREFRRWTNIEPQDHDLLKIVGIGTEEGTYPSFGFFEQQPRQLLQRLVADYLPRARTRIDQLARRPSAWALHTGSGAILDLVQRALSLTDLALEPSRRVLRELGNLNSATGAAVLHSLREAGQTEDVCCMFFGVGFTLQLAWR
jgi:predicted naringenin-chalcone synthase